MMQVTDKRRDAGAEVVAQQRHAAPFCLLSEAEQRDARDYASRILSAALSVGDTTGDESEGEDLAVVLQRDAFRVVEPGGRTWLTDRPEDIESVQADLTRTFVRLAPVGDGEPDAWSVETDRGRERLLGTFIEAQAVAEQEGGVPVGLYRHAAPVGVTSSDERADCKGKGHDVGDPSAACATCHGAPSSDEPEGDERHKLAALLVRWGLCEADSYQAADDILATRPVPVGDAEPVAWLLNNADGSPSEVTNDLRRVGNARLFPQSWTITPLYALPVSSQDAGARAEEWHDYEPSALAVERVAKLLHEQEANAKPWDDCVEATRDYQRERARGILTAGYLAGEWQKYPGPALSNAVDLVLPAEGERRAAALDRMEAAYRAAAPSAWIVSREGLWAAFDALRAAAGKAGSDDA